MKQTAEQTIQQKVVTALRERQWILTTAESCTGGAIGARIVDVPGVSEVFMQGFITYSNQAKQDLIGVKEETLRTYGAVSEQTAREMAEGACRVTQSDVAVSVTGIAGPGGGTKEKPIGLVYIACFCKGVTRVEELHLSGNREQIREQSVQQALQLVYDSIKTSSFS